MTKKLFIVCAALVWTVALVAQNIAVVSPEGETSLYKTLPEAVNGAEDGSVVYLPGGALLSNNTTVIDKKLTIFGVSHRPDIDNADGATKIVGDLYFVQGASESACMGVYLTGSVYFGKSGYESDTIRNVMVKYCNVGNIYSSNDYKTSGLVVNQCYVRGTMFGQSGYDDINFDAEVTHCIIGIVEKIYGGLISNNIIINQRSGYYVYDQTFNVCKYSTIKNNIILFSYSNGMSSDAWNRNNFFDGNMFVDRDLGENCINLPAETTIEDIFVNPSPGISSQSDFHFKDAYKQYEDQVGIYAGTGFSDKQLAPVPYIVAKHVDEQTDAQGKLSIKVRVKAGDSE